MKKFIALACAMLIIGCTNNDPAVTGGPSNAELEKQAKRCQQLRQEIEELKNKPLQRSAAMENYEVECLQQY